MAAPRERKINNSTQRYLSVAEIRENTLIMKDGSLRSVIMTSSINFALKNEDEQNGLIASYVNFLNNVSFPIQIVIQSRELNIESYLRALRQKEKEQTNELLKSQTADYINYIDELISLGKIMNKRFFVIVPYSPLSDQHKNFITRVSEIFTPSSIIKMKQDRFTKLRKELTRRVDSIISSLSAIGLNVVELDTQGLIELFYNTYNPATAGNEKMSDINNLRLE